MELISRIRAGLAPALGVARGIPIASMWVFFYLTPMVDTNTPHPAGDHKGPPNPSSSTLAPTDRPASCLTSQLRLMPIGRPSRSPWLSFTDPALTDGGLLDLTTQAIIAMISLRRDAIHRVPHGL